MYGREKRVLLREYLEQGWSKTAVAEKLGISRRTVYQWIATGQMDRDLDDQVMKYRLRPQVVRKIDGYRGIIQSRLEQYPSTERGAPPCGGAGGRLHRQLYPAQRVCARGEVAPGRRTGGEVRDAARAPGAGRLRPLHTAGGRWCSCWATRGCCGCDSSSGKT